MPTIVEPGDVTGDETTTVELFPGDVFQGSIDPQTDIDAVRVLIEDGYDYVFVVQPDALTPTSQQFMASLWNPNLFPTSARASDTAFGTQEARFAYSTTFSFSAAGEHFVRIESSRQTDIFDYELTFLQDIGRDANTHASLSVGTPGTGTILSNFDRDWFSVDLVQGYSYAFVTQDTSGGTVLVDNLEGRLRDAGGQTLAGFQSYPDESIVTRYNPMADDTFYYEVYWADGYVSNGDYTVTVIQEELNTVDTLAQLQVGGSYDGALEYNGDEDWIAIDLVAGQSYDFTLDWLTFDLPSQFHRLFLRDPNGTFLIETGNVAPGDSGELTYTPMTSGTYFLSVHTTSSDALGSYRLTAAIPGVNQVGGPGPETLSGTAGNDTLIGNGGNDTLFGNDGNDFLNAGDGNDQIWAGPGNDTLVGGNGSDTLGGGAGDDVFAGGASGDVAYAGAGDDVLRGEGGNDELWADSGNDTLFGGTGVDQLGGGSGDDEIWGEADDDLLYGGGGNDLIGGGSGNDAVWGMDGIDELYGGTGNDTMGGGLGADQVWGLAGEDVLYGGFGADTLGGGSENDQLYGGRDSDVLYGGGGNDLLSGGLGHDALWGWDGNDTLTGGLGDDTLAGEGGADTLVFAPGSGNDLVLGFDASEDILELDDALWAGSGMLSAAQVISQFGSVAGGNTVLSFAGGEVITLNGITDLVALEGAIDIL